MFGPRLDGALIAQYDFDTAGSLIDDSSGNGNSLSNNGAVFDSNGYRGGAAYFASGGYLTAPVDVQVATLPEMTWGAWVQASSASVIQTILSHDNGGFDRTLNIDDRGNTIATGGTWSSFDGLGVSSGDVPVAAGEWVFVAAAYDQANSLMRFHVGEQTFTLTTGFDGTAGQEATFAIGRNPNHSEPFTGLIDEVFVYDNFLSESEVNQIRLTGMVPEPGAASLLALSALGLGLRRKRAH